MLTIKELQKYFSFSFCGKIGFKAKTLNCGNVNIDFCSACPIHKYQKYYPVRSGTICFAVIEDLIKTKPALLYIIGDKI